MSEHLDAIRRDLATVVDGARWAHGMAYERRGRGLDAERGTVHRPPTPDELHARHTHPDAVDGPVHDIEHGNHRARTAYQRAVKAVGTCDTYLAAMLGTEGVTVQRAIVDLGPYAPPAQLAKAASNAAWRAALLQHPERHIRRLKHLRTLLDTAVRALSPVLDHGPADDIAHREDKQLDRGIPKAQRCDICDLRKRGKKTGKRCPTCAQYLKRTGVERPKHLDGINPREAQAKRLARGESYGAA